MVANTGGPLGTLGDADWDVLLERIRDGKCTPFLGAGASYGTLPLGAEVARTWAQEYGYPLDNPTDLQLVSQFLAVTKDAMFPKEQILRLFRGKGPPDFRDPDEPHAVLADLPLPVYMTTNYDDFMVRALSDRGKHPQQELCRWNSALKRVPSVFDARSRFVPTESNPVVYHLHGHDKVSESLVLTEDDYLDFLTSLVQNPNLVPPRIQEALTGSSLLFIGYRLADWSFRVVFRSLMKNFEGSLRRLGVAIQLPPGTPGPIAEASQRYLREYFAKMEVRVYWGDARQFCAELRQRWQAAGG